MLQYSRLAIAGAGEQIFGPNKTVIASFFKSKVRLFLQYGCLLSLGMVVFCAHAQSTRPITDAFITKMHAKGAVADIDSALMLADSVYKYAQIEEPAERDEWNIWVSRWRARYYLLTSRIEASENVLMELLTEYESLEKVEGHHVARIYTELSALQGELMDYDKSLHYLDKALALTDTSNHTISWRIYSEMQWDFLMLTKLDSAQKYNRLARYHCERDTLANSFLRSWLIMDQAYLHARLKNFDEAERLAQKATSMVEANHLKDRSYGLMLRIYAQIFIQWEKYDRALGLLDEVFDIFGREPVQESWYFNLVCLSSTCHMALGNLDSAHQLLASVPTEMRGFIYSNSHALSIREKECFLNRNQLVTDNLLTLNKHVGGRLSDHNKAVYDHLVFMKGYSRRSQKHMMDQLIRQSSSPQLAQINTWEKTRTLYYDQVAAKGVPKQVRDSVAWELEKIEKELVRGLNGHNPKRIAEFLGWENVRNALSPGEAAVEFVRFKDKVLKDEVVYGAFLITAQDTCPRFLTVCSASALQGVLKRQLGETDFEHVKRIYNSSSELFELTWQKVLQELPGAHHLYVSYAGLLHNIAHEGLQSPSGELLFDLVNITVLHSTVDIVNLTPYVLEDNDRAVLLGGAAYDLPTSSTRSETDLAANIFTRYGKEIPGNWSYLPGTEREVEKIAALFKQSGREALAFEGLMASEPLLKEAVELPAPEIIHIATHGFRLKTNGDFAAPSTTSHYARSGLILAGANTCQSERKSYEQFGDGVLTAPEINNLHLANTRLVVLSSCRSGLGIVSRTEEVYGLQRAFNIAGAEHVIYTLWDIPDAVSTEFFEHFYSNLLGGMELRGAFKEAKKSMQQNYDTYYWAAFQLIS